MDEFPTKPKMKRCKLCNAHVVSTVEAQTAHREVCPRPSSNARNTEKSPPPVPTQKPKSTLAAVCCQFCGHQMTAPSDHACPAEGLASSPALRSSPAPTLPPIDAQKKELQDRLRRIVEKPFRKIEGKFAARSSMVPCAKCGKDVPRCLMRRHQAQGCILAFVKERAAMFRRLCSDDEFDSQEPRHHFRMEELSRLHAILVDACCLTFPKRTISSADMCREAAAELLPAVETWMNQQHSREDLRSIASVAHPTIPFMRLTDVGMHTHRDKASPSPPSKTRRVHPSPEIEKLARLVTEGSISLTEAARGDFSSPSRVHFREAVRPDLR